MKIINFFVLFFIIISLSFPSVFAEMVTSITTGEDSYALDDIIFINSKIENKFNFSTDLNIETYFTYPDESPIPGSTEYKTITLLPLEDTIFSSTFNPVVPMPIGDYSFHITIFEDNNVLDYQSKTLSVGAAEIKEDKSISLQVNMFKDNNLQTKKVVFKKDETAYIQVIPNRGDVNLDIKLKMPDGSENVLTTSQYIAIAHLNQIGAYSIIVTASKQDYKTIIKTEQFAVIEKPAVIKSVSRCNADTICDDIEDYKSCPQDCDKEKSGNLNDNIKIKYFLYTLIGFIIIIILVVSYIIFKKKKTRNQLINKNI